MKHEAAKLSPSEYTNSDPTEMALLQATYERNLRQLQKLQGEITALADLIYKKRLENGTR